MGERPLKILHLAHIRWFNAEVQYAVDLAGCQRDRGHRVAVLVQSDSPGAAAARALGLETHEEGGFNAKGLGVLGALPAARRLARLLARERFDAVEVHRPEGLPLVVWACRRAGVPAVRVRGDMRPVRRDPLNRWLHTRGLGAVVASNCAIAAGVRQRLGPGVRVETIHGGVDPERFSPLGVTRNLRRELGVGDATLLVGILGRLGPVKGHDAFLEGARQALAAGADAAFVVLAKAGSARGVDLEGRVAADPLLKGRVQFLGHQEDLPAVLREFDLGVVASVGSEANCRVGLEWMASGVPLLATRVGVLPDLVVPGETGFLVPPGSASALAENIVYSADCRAALAALGRAARDRVLDQFTLDRCAAAHEALIRKLLPRSPHDQP